MATLALPADTVRFYNDGPDFPSSPLLLDAERAYRQAFAEAANLVAEWTTPDHEAIDAAWRDRRDARTKAEVLVSSAALFGNPELDSEQVLYRAGHDVEAARHRGRVQAFELAVQCWESLENQGVYEEAAGPLVMRPWAERVREWSLSKIDSATITGPPSPEECIDAGRRALLDRLVEPAEPAVGNLPVPLTVKSVRQLLNENPDLRRPIIHGLLREGETMNVIASPKVGKSWLVVDLALAIATGRMWLDTFECERGDVLIIDNELHSETSANRVPKVMRARGIALDEIADRVFVANVRGRLKDIFSLGEYFQQLPPGRFKLIALDAFYRFMPRDSDENDNGTMAQVYNHLDCFAARLGCAFALVHHSSKGNQSGKTVTDVGAGAGSQSRATDTHLILRPHEQDDVVVLDAAVRSWPPLLPRCLRWTFPVWTPDDALDPASLRPERPRRRPKAEPSDNESIAAVPAWDARRFVEAFVGPTPATILALTQAAMDAGLSERKATKLLKQAEAQGLIHRWKFGATHPVRLATIPQPETSP
jgi:hypothetical protein